MSDTNRTDMAGVLAAVLPLALIQIVAWGTVYFSFPLLLDALQAKQGWSRNQVAGGLTLGLAVSALAQWRIGRLIEHWGAPMVLAVGCVLGAVAMLWLAMATTLAEYYLAWTALGVTMALAFFEPAFAALLERVPHRFDLSVALLVMLSGLAGAVFLPVTHWLLEDYGWRNTVRAFAVCLWGAGLVAVLLRAGWRAGDHAQTAVRDGLPTRSSASPGGNAAASLRELRFWSLALSFACNTGVVTMLAVHLLHFLGQRGFNETQALAATAAMGPAQILGRLAQMALSPKLSFGMLTRGAFCALLGGVLMLQASSPELPLLWPAVLCLGAGSGMITTLRGTVVARLFQRSQYPRAAGMVAAPGSLFRAGAPLGVSLLASGTAGYTTLGWLMVVLAAVSLLLINHSLRAYQDDTD